MMTLRVLLATPDSHGKTNQPLLCWRRAAAIHRTVRRHRLVVGRSSNVEGFQ